MMVMVQRCDTILCISRAVTTDELPTESTTWNLTEKLNEKLTKIKPMRGHSIITSRSRGEGGGVPGVTLCDREGEGDVAA